MDYWSVASLPLDYPLLQYSSTPLLHVHDRD